MPRRIGLRSNPTRRPNLRKRPRRATSCHIFAGIRHPPKTDWLPGWQRREAVATRIRSFQQPA